ncbi:MAG: sigma-70 family RNA polymerase sigma factor [Planctomycetota bacterium]
MSDVLDSADASELLRGACAGDLSSLEKLLEKYNGYLTVLSRARCDSRLRSRIGAGDLVQETLMEAFRDFGSFSGTTTAEFTGWLRQILIHNIGREVERNLDAAKRDVRRERPLQVSQDSVQDSEHRLSAILADSHRGPATEAELQDDLVQLAAAIERLPMDYREVILLRHIEGLQFAEVAKRIDRTPGAARMLWVRAIGKLRDKLEEEA